MLQNLPPWATRVLSGSVYLFVVAVGIWSLMEPYMKYEVPDTIEVYFDKQCLVGVQCDSLDNDLNRLWYNQGMALQALYILLIILAGVCFLLYVFNQKRIFNILSFVLLAIALGTLITLIVIVKTSSFLNIDMEFTSASILIIIACCFMIVKQFFSNDYIRGFIMIPFRN